MEDPEKRKERLKAMRMEAAHSGLESPGSGNHTTGHLVNPLAQSSTASPAHEGSASFPRFDYYTDPMSAFSGSKKRNNAEPGNLPSAFSSSPGPRLSSPFSGPRNTNMIPFPAPANQFQVNYSPYRGSHRPQTPPQLSPAGMANPFPMHSPFHPPGMQHRSLSPSGFSNPPHTSGSGYMSPRGRGSPHSNSGRGSQYMNSGRGGYNSRFASSPSPCRFGSNSDHSGFRNGSGHSGWSGGWTKGTGEHVSALKAPQLFYNKSMVQDPWEGLSPIVGCILVTIMPQKTPSSSSWLPSSITTKKAKVDEGGGKTTPSRSSLAEFLALSFEEAANDESEI